MLFDLHTEGEESYIIVANFKCLDYTHVFFLDDKSKVFAIYGSFGTKFLHIIMDGNIVYEK